MLTSGKAAIQAGAALVVAAGLGFALYGPGSDEHVVRAVLLEELSSTSKSITYRLVADHPPAACLAPEHLEEARVTLQLQPRRMPSPASGSFCDIRVETSDEGCELIGFEPLRPQ